MFSFRWLPLAGLFAGLFPAAAGAVTPTVAIDGDRATATIALPGGLNAELAVRFESVVGLSPAALGLSVDTVDPVSPQLSAALPDPLNMSVPSGFPVRITIEPPAEAGLAFEGLVEIEIYTRNLHYTADTPLRLFSSSNGEPFRDITTELAGGSYRVRGSGGQFSEFVVLADTRPLTDVVDAKFLRLEQRLTAHWGAIAGGVASDLDSLLAAARAAWQAGDAGAAIEQIRFFEETVAAAAATGAMPGVWRSSRDLDNVAGMLRADAGTLRLSLGLAAAVQP